MLPLPFKARVLFTRPVTLNSTTSLNSRSHSTQPEPPPKSGDRPSLSSSSVQRRPRAQPQASNHRCHQVRHEVREGNRALNIPFNPSSGGGGPGTGGTSPEKILTGSPFLDTALSTIIGLTIVFGGGVIYVAWYKKRVLDKIEESFSPGYDPALELATHHSHNSPDAIDANGLRRIEQDLVDKIIHGKDHGHYYVFLGPKGSGKGTMIFDSMKTSKADGVSMCDAHPDLEVFRLRLGKALNFKFHEDSQTGLFQRRDPREGGPALDIERALNKLEKVALRVFKRRGCPLVLVINNVHFFKNDDQGRNMILQLQQRAEAWAVSGILTLVFTSDDYWPFHVMRQTASRMQVVSIYDLNIKESFHAAASIRRHTQWNPASHEELNEAVGIVGGRLSYLSRIAKAKDMLHTATHMQEIEKAWLLSQIGLIGDCDDDVMDEQKWSSCTWLLLQEFVNIRKEQEEAQESAKAAGDPAGNIPLDLPVIPYWKCRQIMTRADFLEKLDHLNVISIDINHNVRPDSMLILHAAQDVVQEESFQVLLENVRDRIDEIESLHRTRELTIKGTDKLVKLSLTIGDRDDKAHGGHIV